MDEESPTDDSKGSDSRVDSGLEEMGLVLDPGSDDRLRVELFRVSDGITSGSEDECIKLFFSLAIMPIFLLGTGIGDDVPSLSSSVAMSPSVVLRWAGGGGSPKETDFLTILGVLFVF